MTMTTTEHTRQLSFLAEQSPQVLQDFCKLATDYLYKGPNLKIYGAAAHKLIVEPEAIRRCVEGLINLLLESKKRGLSIKGFEECIQTLGFDDEKGQAMLCELYETEQSKIFNAYLNIGVNLSKYRNIEWRFQVDIASRSLFRRLSPVFAIDLTLNDDDDNDNERHILMQIDPTNLLHLTRQLESAVQQARSQHTRKIKRTVKT